MTAQLEVTDRCNFKCRHCYHFDFDNDFQSTDLDDSSVISLAKILCDSGVFSVVITGGEPLYRPKLTLDLINLFKKKNVQVSLNTNLSLVTGDIISAFSKSGLDSMLVSCPSIDPVMYKEMTGGGDIVVFLRKLDVLVRSGINFFINMVVNKKNLLLIKNTGIELSERGVKKFGATPMSLNSCNPDLKNFLSSWEVNRIAEDLLWLEEKKGLKIDMFEALPKCLFSDGVRQKNPSFLRRSCQAGKTVVSVSNTGDVRTCSHNNDVYGNLFMNDITDIWDKMSTWRSDGFIPKECQNCAVVGMCLGGCRISSKAFSGHLDSKDPWMTDVLLNNHQSKKFLFNNDLSVDLKISFPGKMRFRKEREGQYLVATNKGNRNASLVNRELFKFLSFFNELKQPISILDLATKMDIKLPNNAFINIIKKLLNKGIIIDERRYY
jgi:radical SAM protein with 4Fe4S-binding SPASM domain